MNTKNHFDVASSLVHSQIFLFVSRHPQFKICLIFSLIPLIVCFCGQQPTLGNTSKITKHSYSLSIRPGPNILLNNYRKQDENLMKTCNVESCIFFVKSSSTFFALFDGMTKNMTYFFLYAYQTK